MTTITNKITATIVNHVAATTIVNHFEPAHRRLPPGAATDDRRGAFVMPEHAL